MTVKFAIPLQTYHNDIKKRDISNGINDIRYQRSNPFLC